MRTRRQQQRQQRQQQRWQQRRQQRRQQRWRQRRRQRQQLAEGFGTAAGNARLRFETACGSLYEAQAGIGVAVAWAFISQEDAAPPFVPSMAPAHASSVCLAAERRLALVGFGVAARAGVAKQCSWDGAEASIEPELSTERMFDVLEVQAVVNTMSRAWSPVTMRRVFLTTCALAAWPSMRPMSSSVREWRPSSEIIRDRGVSRSSRSPR